MSREPAIVTSVKTWNHTTAREPTCELKNTLHILDYYFSENKTETEPATNQATVNLHITIVYM